MNAAQISVMAQAMGREVDRQAKERGRRDLDLDLVARAAIAALESRGYELPLGGEKDIEPCDIVQAKAPGHWSDRQLFIVAEVTSWGLKAYQHAEFGGIYVRLERGSYYRTGGRAPLVLNEGRLSKGEADDGSSSSE